MKRRIFVIIAILFIAFGLVTLMLTTLSNMMPEQAQLDQSNLTQVIIQSPEPERNTGSGDPMIKPMNDLYDSASTRLVTGISPGRSLQIPQSGSTSIPWSPPIQNQIPANQSNAGQTVPYINPPDQSQSPEEDQQVSDYANPAGRGGFLANAGPETVSPVVSLPVSGDETRSSQPSPESIQPPLPGVSVDLAYDIILGYLSAGDLVTATTLSGSAFGFAEADGTGYFFTPLWGTDGRQVDLVGGETIEIYHNGSNIGTITTPAFSGGMMVDTNQVTGTVGGLSAGDVVTVSLGIWGGEPNTETPWVTATTDISGTFTAYFSSDLGPHNFARVESQIAGVHIYHYVYPINVFNVDSFNYIFGYAQPYQPVTVTVFISDTSTVRSSQIVQGNWPHGDYTAEMLVEPGDTVEVDLGSGNLSTLETENFTAIPDLAGNLVLGQAPAFNLVRVFIYNWMNGVYTETNTSANVNGYYTATFQTYDLTAQDAIYPAYAGGDGSEVLLSVFPPRIQVFPDTDGVIGNGDAPQAPFTYTLTQAGHDYTINGTTDALNGTGWANFSTLGVDIVPGDLITLETPTWSGSMVVADLTLVADTENDGYLGSVDQPGDVTIVSFPWPAWSYPVYKFDSGTATANPNYTISLPGHDVRAGVSGRVIHNDANYFTTRKNFEVRYFDLDLPWGVNSPQYDPNEVITATLYYSDQVTIKRQVSQDNDSNPNYYWLDFDGQIAAGDWISVTNGSDWSASLSVPNLTLEADRQTDLISGTAPETLLYVEGSTSQSGFGVWTPSFDDGAGQRFVVDASAFGVDMDFGSWATVYYQAANGNRARRSFGFPDLYARYNPDGSSSVFGNNAIPGNTIYITITNSLSEIVASGTTQAGTAWMGPSSYNLDFPFYGFSPGDEVHIDYGSSLTNTLWVVELTAQADINNDLVTGLAPADSWLNASINDQLGNGTKLDQIQVSPSGTYTLDFGAIGWDINNGDGLSVYYPAGNGGVVERAINLPRPDLNFAIYNTNGGAQPGGPYAYGVWLSNDGDLAAQDVQVEFTLPPSTTWSGDTSGVLPQIGADGVITWSLGTMAANEQRNIFITLLLDPAHPTGDGALAPLCGSVSTSTSGEGNLDNNSSCAGNTYVQVDDIDIRVDKWPSPGDVVAGQEFVYDIQYCNDRSVAAGPVWLTDTLPVSTTFVSLTPRGWWGEVFWSEQTISDGILNLYFPSIPAQSCTDIDLRLRADENLFLNTTLSNYVEVYTAGDVYVNNNWRLNEDARISTPRADLGLGKYFDNGILVPGGELAYKLDYYNSGNFSLIGVITDTLPTGTAYVVGSAFDNGHPATPTLVTDDQIVWDLGEIGVYRGSELTYRLSIQESVIPDTTLENCATIGHTSAESNPGDNTACDERTVQDHGPNLEISKYHQWYGDGWLHYEITFRNLGDEDVNDPIITDTYPLSTTFAGWGYNYWNNISLTEDPANRQLIWQVDQLPAGNGGSIRFEAPLENPGQRMLWYTNTVEIHTPAGEANPVDNFYTDVAFSGGEVDRAEMSIGTDSANVWGSAQPGSTVSVLNHGVIYTGLADPNCGGCYNVDNIGPLWPGDTITVTAGAGLQPVVIHVPAPFSAEADSRTEQVTGQVGVPEDTRLRVELYGYAGTDVFVNASGFYTATFTDIPRGGQGEVRFETTIDYTQTYFHRRFKTPDLTLSVNYGHDWVNGRYEISHTVWITVTESDGSSIKASAEVVSYPIPWWNYDIGFEPQDQDWIPSRPDIQAGDWVYGAVDSGYTTTVQLGIITGVVDPDNDLITGTISAPWITQPVEIRCHTWGSPNNAPQKQDFIQPNGVDIYSCAWNPLTEWDVQPGQEIGVEYYEPDGDSVFNAFHAPSPDLRVQINPRGTPGEGGNLQLQVQYVNQGEIESNDVIITQTLQGMQYLGDTSAFGSITGTTPGGDPYVVYQLGNLPPGDWMQFDVFAQVTEPASQTITSTVRIVGTPDGGNLGDKERSWSGHVENNNTHINLGKGPWTGDPVAGGQFVWYVNACNNGSTSSSGIVLTDTLPAHMVLLEWWGQHPGWSQVSWDPTQLVVSRPSLPNGWCSQVYLRFQVDPDVLVGTNIQNTAQVWAANDMESNDNQATSWVNINNPHTNLSISQWWGGGSLVPGGTFRYQMNYNNNGNIPVDGVFITDTLPVSTMLDYIRRYDQSWNFIGYVTPTYIGGNQIVWEVGTVENGENGNFEVSVRVDTGATPGISLVNTAEISRLPGEDTYSDNTSSWTETLFDHGPNLRISKRYSWNGDTQLNYQIDFANVGDQVVSTVWITDDLPDNTIWGDWWNMGFDWNRLITQTLSANQLRWEFSNIYPGDNGWLQFNAILDDPNARPRWYTNTATISLDPEDTNPADNIATISMVLGEVERVQMWVNPGGYGMWGEAQPGVTVTVTKGTEQFTAFADPSCSGCWNIGGIPPLLAGEKITVTAGLGQLPVIITAPDPFTVHADSDTNTVSGQIDQLDHQSIQVNLYGYNQIDLQTDTTGNFTATFPDIPPAGNGHVRYETTIDYAQVDFHYRFQADDLLLRVNIAHEWVEAVYPAGHTVWITVTNSLGEQKATYLDSTQVSAARGSDGFETQGWRWSPGQPDIQEGDWVYARTDDGKTAQVQVGVITGELDLLADSISGTITAPFSTTLRTICEVYIGNGPPSIEGSVDPAGGSYSCSWAGIYDLQPDMNVAVNYFEPSGHQIIDVFWIGRPSVYIRKWGDGQLGEGGNYIFHINYQNQGNWLAEDVVITDTLPVGMSYLGDTAPFSLTSSSPLVWELGNLPSGSNATFDVYVQVDAPVSTTLTNIVEIDTSTAWDSAPPENKVSVWTGTVSPNDTHLYIYMGTSLGDPAPGSHYSYWYNICNSGSTNSSGVVFTATLPVSTTLTGWTGSGWSQLSLIDQELVLSYPSVLNNYSCATANLSVLLDANSPLGLPLEASGVITASNDMESYDNQISYQHSVGAPRIEQWINKNFNNGLLVPGSTLEFNIQYGYDANFSPGIITITDTLPISTTFVDAWRWGPSGLEYLTPLESGPGFVVFEFNGLTANSYGDSFNVRVQVDAAAIPGTQLTNTTQIRPHILETYLNNNLSSWSGMLLAHNADLAVSSTGGWDLPNNTANLGFTIYNSGDLGSGPITITTTYPVSMSLIDVIYPDGHNTTWQDYPDMHYFTATMDNIAPGEWAYFYYFTQMEGGGSIPGGQVFTFETDVSVPPADFNPANNQTSFTLASGPDLFVEKTLTSSSYLPGGSITYNLHVGNRSVANGWNTQGNVLITDTLPAGLNFTGSSWSPSLVDGQTIVWNVGNIGPGWNAGIDVYATITNTALGGDIFTNSAIIASTNPADVDINPSDNSSTITMMVREVTQVDLQVGVEHAWIMGYAIPDRQVSVQTASGVYTTTVYSWGWWQFGDIGSIQPGDVVTVTAGSGGLPVVIHIPAPFSANIDSTLEQVWGQISGAAGQTVYVDPWWGESSQQVLVDPGGVYTATFGDIPSNGPTGEVRYFQMVNAAQVTFHRPFHESYVNLTVNKSGNTTPAPGGNYTYQINYRNESGEFASNVILTDTLPAGMTYLSDSSGLPVSLIGNQVVWQLGDLGSTDTGFQLYVAVDPGLAPGTLLTNIVQIATPTFEWNYIDNTYQWDVTAASNDTHLSISVNASPDDPAPGSQYPYNFVVCNNGTTASSGVVLTATLPISTTFINWTGSSWIQESFVGQELVLSNPSLMGYNCNAANVFVQLDANATPGWLLEARGVITASNDMESGDNQSIYQHNVGAPRIDQWITKYFNSGNLVPGSTLLFNIGYGYDANFSPGVITITDTLPVSTTFIDAWRYGPSGQESLTPAASGPGYVIFEFDGLTANSYSRDFYMRVQVDEAAIPGTVMTNTAEIQTHAIETNLDNNLSSWSGILLAHNADLSVTSGGSWNLPNNWAALWFNFHNTGDLSSGPVTITVTYPVSMSLLGDIYGDWRMTDWQDYPDQHYFTATLPSLEPGGTASFSYLTQMQGGGSIPGGQVFTFETDVSVPPADFNPANNHASFTLASGPDLFVEKTLAYGTLAPGGMITYNLYIGDRSTSSGWNLQGSVRITDTLPAGLTYSGSSWGPILIDGQTIVWDVGAIWAGWYSWIDVYATITNTAQGGDSFTNTAIIASTSPADVDLNATDNSSSHSFTIMAPVFDISKQTDGDLIVGTLVTYTLSVTNTGNATGTNVQIYDPIPQDLTYFNSDGTYDGSAMNWTLPQLAPHESAQVWFSAYLTTTVGVTITNQNYLVTGSDQGITSPVGAPVSFEVRDLLLLAPSDLGATAASCTQINLSWTDNSLDETDFRIERSLDGTSGWEEIATVNADTTTYTDTIWSAATTIFYQVRGYRSSDNAFSGYSNIASATTHSCTLVLNPSVFMAGIGQNFDLVIEVQAGTQLVDGAAAYLNFDPAYLQVVSITPGSSLPIVLENSYNNTAGQVNFASGTLSGFPSGTFTLVTVTFHAQIETPETSILFNEIDPRKSDITYGGYSILSGAEGSTVTITPNASIQASVTLQGRPAPPNPRWSVPLMVDLTLPGQTTPIYSFTPTTDSSGNFTLSEITPGSYDVWVKNSHTLQNRKTVTLVAGSNGVDLGTLREGDANNNNVVNLLDFSILATTFSKCQGTPGYDDRADFNEDTCVTLPDFSLLATNFGQAGPIIITNLEGEITAPGRPEDDVFIVVQPALINVNQGDTFDITIQLQSGSQLLDGAQADLDFDPTKLRVISLTGNTTAFPMVLMNTYNNTSGTIDYAAGTFSNYPSGNVNLVVIRFEALGETQTTPLTFIYGGGRNTDATFGGFSVLTGDQDGQMQIGFFNKTSPADGALNVPISPTLTWTTSLGASSYEYCYDTSDDDACSGWTSNGTGNSVTLPELSPTTIYYWHVRAVNALGAFYSDGTSTAYWSFTTEEPTPVRLVDFNATSLPQGIRLDWQTVQEIDLLGFNLFRAEALEGPRIKINPLLIPGINPGQLRGNDYQYMDATAKTGKTYYYWVVWVGNSNSELYGPVSAKLAPFKVWMPLSMR